MQLNLVGDLGVVVKADTRVTYEQVETALHEQAILSGYTLSVTDLVDSTEIYIGVGVPVETITAEGVPALPAVQLLRALSDALAALQERLNG